MVSFVGTSGRTSLSGERPLAPTMQDAHKIYGVGAIHESPLQMDFLRDHQN